MIKQIEVSGSHYEMGYQQGEILSDRIANDFEKFIEYLEQLKNIGNIPVCLSSKIFFHLLCIIGRVKIKKALKHLPHQLHRIEGLSDGCKKPLNWFLGTNIWELLIGEVKRYLQFQSCTAVILSSSATEDREILLGKNYDFPYFLKDFQIIRISHPKNRYSSISLTQDIITGNHNGMNEHGLTVLYTYCYPAYDKIRGIPISILIEEILETCRTTEEAITFLKKINRGNGANLGISDIEGNFCVVEISPNYLQIRKQEQGYIIHTNNYITQEMSKIDTPDSAVYKIKHPKLYGIPHNESSRERYKRAEELVKQNLGNFNFENFENLFRDHKHKGDSENNICRKGPIIGTLSSIIFSPKKRIIKVCYGNPCSNEYKIYSF